MITTVVGSYPKVAAGAQGANLRAAIARHDAGQVSQAELDRVSDELTKEVIREQVDAGLDLITDGQIRWDDGQTYLARRIKGFQLDGLTRYFDTNTYYRHPVSEAKLEWQGPITVADYRFAAKHSSKPVKAVLTGPYTMARLSQRGCYSDLGALVMDLAQIMNQEALALQAAGATLIQFDEPAILKYKEDMDLLQQASERLTHGLTVKTAAYTYFGDLSGIHTLFFKLPFQVFGLDFIMGKANYQLIRDLPQDKDLAAGVVDARNTKMEGVEVVASAIKAIARHVSLDRLYLNPSAGLEFLPRPTAQAKLARLVEGARKAQEVFP